MTGFGSSLAMRAREFGGAVALVAVGVLFGIAGIGFLLAALWLLVALHHGAVIAFATVGVLLIALAFGLMAFSQRKSGARAAHTAAQEEANSADAQPGAPFLRMAEGFAMGMEAGRAARATGRGRHRAG
ncbi:hypothetical protein SAMN05661107_2750 [Maritimibacter sp. HL-12]|nr:hypothetical protein SAMN05661107_2750 [Maritimibacter sp. HL-12]